MSMTGDIEHVEVITSVHRRRRWSTQEKAAIVQETYAPGMSVQARKVAASEYRALCAIMPAAWSPPRQAKSARYDRPYPASSGGERR